MKWYWKVLKNYANCKGRASRKEFWWFQIINSLTVFLLIFVEIFWLELNPSFGGTTFALLSNGLDYGVLGTIYGVAVLSPAICVTVRRLHDIGKSGKWYWILVIPIISLYGLYLLVKPSVKEVNQYGSPPEDVSSKVRNQKPEAGVKTAVVVQSAGRITPVEQLEWNEKPRVQVNFCRNCGHRLEDESNFCSHCGTKVLKEW